MRLASRSDEAFGDVATARDRIDGYRGGAVPFSRRDTPETVLKVIAKIARQLEPIDHRRKVILCLGLPAGLRRRRAAARRHQRALAGLGRGASAPRRARTSASTASIRPARRGGVERVGRRSRAADRRQGLRARERFRAGRRGRSGAKPATTICSATGPGASKRELRSIDVSVARKGVHVRARQRR